MFNSIGITKGLSFVKILGGLSKTLQIANQVIPLYQKARPVLANAKNMLGVLKEINKPNANTIKNETQTSSSIEIKTNEKTQTAPKFFL